MLAPRRSWLACRTASRLCWQASVVGEGCDVGEGGQSEIALIASDTVLPAGYKVLPGEQVGPEELEAKGASDK